MGDLIYTTGVYSVVESLIWQSILVEALHASAATGAGDEVSPLVIDGGAHIGECALRKPIIIDTAVHSPYIFASLCVISSYLRVCRILFPAFSCARLPRSCL